MTMVATLCHSSSNGGNSLESDPNRDRGLFTPEILRTIREIQCLPYSIANFFHDDDDDAAHVELLAFNVVKCRMISTDYSKEPMKFKVKDIEKGNDFFVTNTNLKLANYEDAFKKNLEQYFWPLVWIFDSSRFGLHQFINDRDIKCLESIGQESEVKAILDYFNNKKQLQYCLNPNAEYSREKRWANCTLSHAEVPNIIVTDDESGDPISHPNSDKYFKTVPVMNSILAGCEAKVTNLDNALKKLENRFKRIDPIDDEKHEDTKRKGKRAHHHGKTKRGRSRHSQPRPPPPTSPPPSSRSRRSNRKGKSSEPKSDPRQGPLYKNDIYGPRNY